jgi:hypothetical protein
MKIPESKRTKIRIIAEFSRIPNGCPNLAPLHHYADDALQGAPLPFHPAHWGGIKVAPQLLYQPPPLTLLPSNIEARALVNASFCCAPTAILSCRHPMCFRRTPSEIFSCCCPTMLLMPCSCCNLFLSNASATAGPPPSSEAAMLLLFKTCFCSCNLLLLPHSSRLL